MKHIRSFFQVPLAYLCLFSFLLASSSCHYYKNRSLGKEDQSVFQNFEERIMLYADSYYFVHIGDAIFLLDDKEFDREDNTISGVLAKVPDLLADYYSGIAEKKLKRYPKDEKRFIKQIHFFVDGMKSIGDRIIISEQNILEIQVLSPATFPTFITYAGATSISAFVGFLIFLAIVCGCPHVDLPDLAKSKGYDYTLFTGAIASSLERSDFQYLGRLTEISNLYMQVRNEEKEIQYIDYLTLREVRHRSDQEAVIDQGGNAYLYSTQSRVLPEVFPSDLQVSQKGGRLYGNSLSYYFVETEGDFAYLEMGFPGQSEGLLVLTARNTRWSAFVYDQFLSLFGDRYQSWSQNVRQRNAENLLKWPREQGILLEVQQWTDTGWESIEYLNLVGDIASNTIAIPVKSRDHSLRIRLKSGFGLWEVQDVSLYTDFKAADQVREIAIAGADYPELSAKDSVYLILEQDRPFIEANFTVDTSVEASYFIHSEGYYVPKKNIKGKTQFARLLRMRKPGSFSNFSKELYENLHK